jgi:DNA-binding transcriptional LysR family regulator
MSDTVDVRQLKFFMTIARLGNFTRAAEQLHIAQPALSIAIRKLEEELDVVLFNRRDRKVTLTAEGEILLAHAGAILAGVGAAEQEMADLTGLRKGEVRMGIPPMLSSYFFPDIICAFKRRYPRLNLSVYGEGAGRIQRMISQGDLDMGVIAGQPINDDLEARHFLREEVVACVPVGHRLADREGIAFAEFAAEPLVFYKEGYYLRELLFDKLKGEGLVPHIVFETNLFSLVKSLVRGGLGIAAFLRMVVAGDTDLVAIPFHPPLHLDLLIAWKRHAYLSRANRAFVEFLMERTERYGTEAEMRR